MLNAPELTWCCCEGNSQGPLALLSLLVRMMMGLSWWQWLYGWWRMVVDLFLQPIRCAHLPTRLPLTLSPCFNVIVTGATSGIGAEIAGELARAGAHVVLAVRNTVVAGKLVQEWVRAQNATGGPVINAEVMELDLLSLASVRAFAKQWNGRQLPLHVLVNNAGIFAMGVKQRISEDGYEHHMQVNHLGHALLSMLLLPSLICGGPQSRIVNVNSELHHMGFVDPDDMNFAKREYRSLAAYSSSKLAQVLFSSTLHRRIFKETGVAVILLHPGQVLMTNISRDLPPIVRNAEKSFTEGMGFTPYLTPLEGARSTLICATEKQVYQYACDLREMGRSIAPFFSSACRPCKTANLADDLEYAERVYSKTLDLVGLPDDYLDRALGNKSFSGLQMMPDDQN